MAFKKTSFEWVHCNQCLRSTKHEILLSRSQEKQEESDQDKVVDWKISYTILECRGCGAVVLRHSSESDTLGELWADYFPPPISREIPNWIWSLPHEFRGLINEMYAALHADCKRLALMGARSIIDMFMNATIGDIGGFEKKLNKLGADGHLSKKNMEILKPALEVGHAVTHRAHEPAAEDVVFVFDIVENLIQPMALKAKAERLAKRIPSRKSSA